MDEIKVKDNNDADIISLEMDGVDFAIISRDGKLKKFDNDLCRKAAKTFDTSNKKEIWMCIAKLIILVLDNASMSVEHILKEGGGTQGDKIRSFSKKDVNEKLHKDSL